MDDTNPEKECQEYIDNIHENVAWLGYKAENNTFASEYFEQLFEYAC
jgi:glutaminyl-tRNA synthetase